jgi:hypothetical protein
VLQAVRRFCDDSIGGKDPGMSLDNCANHLKSLKTPYNFDAIKDAIKKGANIDICKCGGYATVNAVRIVNNSFKHNSGRYDPEQGQAQNTIDKQLLKQWAIKAGRVIDYTKVPVQDLIAASHAFCSDLLDKLEISLAKQVPAIRAAGIK